MDGRCIIAQDGGLERGVSAHSLFRRLGRERDFLDNANSHIPRRLVFAHCSCRFIVLRQGCHTLHKHRTVQSHHVKVPFQSSLGRPEVIIMIKVDKV